jgi:hypothetical protein
MNEHNKNSPWENIALTRCEVEFASMQGSSSVRECGYCGLNVYNINDVSPDVAEKLILEKEGELPKFLLRRPDATLLTAECPMNFQGLPGPYSAEEDERLRSAMSALKTTYRASYRFTYQPLLGNWQRYVFMRYRDWNIRLEVIPRTKVYASVQRLHDFRFNIFRESFFSELRQNFGEQDIQFGDDLFDALFALQSNSPDQLRALLKDDRVRTLLQRQACDEAAGVGFVYQIDFYLKDIHSLSKPKSAELAFVAHHLEIRDNDRLSAIVDLVATTLDTLAMMQLISYRAPD